ncbi:hypothetical protein [Bacillus atrophaeus]|uniref:hypothetical protein n=1 Tax=Bacillus atrophaeus TaxID=1452 RepID=UPI002280AA0A|nr:hypothetical protein [Bacillus atrophaeus]MCY8466501.1 hypothetical protein [Bacillus atrophaeus]MCY8478960.1 hypothetical protein [Bacillus atrophaeus]
MSIAEIFKGEHFALDENKLIPIENAATKINYESFCEILKISPEHLFLNPDSFINRYCYWDELYYHPFMSLDTAILNMKMGKYSQAEHINKRITYVHSAYESKQWNEIIKFTDKKVLFHVYKKLRPLIPEEERTNVFLNIHVRSESGYDIDLVRSVIDGPKDASYDMSNAQMKPKDGYYVIYRGSTPESTPVGEAFSWTLSKEIAEFFAGRFNSNGVVYQAKVHKDKVKAFINNKEQEVIAFPEDIIDIKEI